MAVKRCCVGTCNSCSTRKEDRGVTYHKFPKDVTLCDIWISVTNHKKSLDSVSPVYVCSRHFCKDDFQLLRDSKYVLKSDAVPSIFPWVIIHSDDEMEALNTVENQSDGKNNVNVNENKVNDDININNDINLKDKTKGTKEVDIENVDAIKKYIEQQEREIEELKSEELKSKLLVPEELKEDKVMSLNMEEPLSLSSTVIDMMMNENEMDTVKKDEKDKALISCSDKGNSIALSVGSKVEAKDFHEGWYPACIIEVDFDEMEVLVHYETDTKKLDEWINVSSPRLRPEGSAPTVKPGPSSAESLSDTIPISVIKEEIKEQKEKAEEKAKLTYAVGERCLARWRDNRRFVATVLKDVGDDNYEIVFDDGFHWKCKASRLCKWKGKGEASDASLCGPGIGEGPSNAPVVPAYHTHLFDPTRDYLGSKSERRERKRKLNIKEIFNIGQKKQKTQKDSKEQKVQIEKKPKVVRSKKKIQLETEIKQEMPDAADAVASIIGSVNTEKPTPKVEVKKEISDIIDEENNSIDENTEIIEVPLNTCDSEDDVDNKMDLDTVLKEESKLEKFEKPDETHHEEVIDRIKEAINKLEDGLVQAERLASPKPEQKIEIPVEQNVEEDKVATEVKEQINEIKEDETEVNVDVVEMIPEQEKLKTSEETLHEEENTEVKLTKDLITEPKLIAEIPKMDQVKNFSIVLEKIQEKPQVQPTTVVPQDDKSKKLSKVKKGKKLRLLREKKVKKQVAKVKSELEAMKKQVEEMRKQMLKSQELGSPGGMPETFLLPGEWCCKWVNGQPVGQVSEIESDVKLDPASGKPPLPRRSVQVEDKRLPEGWTKHMVRRSFGHSAGKWDVVLVSPENRRFHTKHEMRNYLEQNPSLAAHETGLLDFGIHLKLARRMGWITRTSDGTPLAPASPLPAGTLCSTSPLIKRKNLGLKKSVIVKGKNPKMKRKKIRARHDYVTEQPPFPIDEGAEIDLNAPPLEDGYVYCGSLKVQIIETLLRCPAEGCLKNFRNTTLLQMHIKHYHRELRKMMGATPKVLDLAYARTMPTKTGTARSRRGKTIKVKISRPKREDVKPEFKVSKPETLDGTPPLIREPFIPRSLDSPKLRKALANRPLKRPKVLLPVSRADPDQPTPDILEAFEDHVSFDMPAESLDFETAISTHTVTKPAFEKKKGDKKRKTFALAALKPTSEEEEWMGISSDVDTRSSFPGSGTPDSKIDKPVPLMMESLEDKSANMYTYTENGERIKIVHMKREEIINCHCGFREEDGLMVQCELCLCWQHALCHNIQREQDVPEKYTCSICLNPRRGRRSMRFVHDQDRLYEGLLPAAKPCESLRRSHELTGNLLRIEDALHALRVKYYVATKKDHPKLYLWAKDWEQAEIQYTQEKLNSDYSDLNIMINSIGKENLPLKPDDVRDLPLDIRTPPSEELEQDRYTHREGPLGSQALLSSLLSSPGGASLDLPISTSELERLAKSVQEQEMERHVIMAPQPEAAIEDGACRERLLRHLARCQALVDARLDSIEAQVAELESQDPSLQDDETADFYPRTKQTIQLLMRDLDTMEELGVIT